MDDLTHESWQTLARACHAQIQRFAVARQNDPRFCLELLRRAFDGGDPQAGDAVYAQFAPPLQRWLRGRKLTPEQVEDVVQETFARLLAQSRHGTFRVATYTLPQVLWFIKRCALIVAQEQRQPSLPAMPDVSDYPGMALDLRIDLEALMARLRPLLLPEEWALLEQKYFREQQPTEATLHCLKLETLRCLLKRRLPAEDCALFERRYATRMPPRELAQQMGVDVRVLYRRLATIMRRVRNDPMIQNLMDDI